MKLKDIRRFQKYFIMLNPPNGCWEWIGYIQKNGYGSFRLGDKKIMAHRVSYVIINGKIPDGLEIDHLCFNRKCVNPSHLEAVTHRENLLRSPTLPTINRKKTHCPQGHEYVIENLYLDSKGYRHCRKCLKNRYLNIKI